MKIVRVLEKSAGILYSSVTGMMVMEFADRGRYIYHDVPKAVYDVLFREPEEPPGDGFQPVEPDLEDFFFSRMIGT